MKNHLWFIFLILISSSAWASGLSSQRTPDDIRYIVGGVGIEQREAMKALYDQYSLKLEVAEKSGAYVADVHVMITDTGGREYLHIRQQGPILLIDLPDGQYNIEATYRGMVQKRKLQIKGSKPVRTIFLW